MKLKKTILFLVLAMCLNMAIPAFADNVSPATNIEQPANDVHARQLITRLKEIREMDKSNLTSSEKKALRKEVKEMKREVKADRGRNGIYISVGALIIIILLLIILL